MTRLLDMGLADSSAVIDPDRGARPAPGPPAVPGVRGAVAGSELLLERLQHQPDGITRALPQRPARACAARSAARCAATRAISAAPPSASSWLITDRVRRQILESGTEAAIQAAALEGDMITMFDDGLATALRGETSIDEVLRVTRMN